jgi:hypothetical protein
MNRLICSQIPLHPHNSVLLVFLESQTISSFDRVYANNIIIFMKQNSYMIENIDVLLFKDGQTLKNLTLQ